jgi:hypothetical protein
MRTTRVWSKRLCKYVELCMCTIVIMNRLNFWESSGQSALYIHIGLQSSVGKRGVGRMTPDGGMRPRSDDT